jgi:ABC-2 type transport system ATP-binding protein
MSIEVQHISKVYGSQKALDEVSFSIDKNEIVGFLGPNGAGKSTLMKILTTYLEPTSGHAKVNGFSIQDQAVQVQKSVGYLPEHNPLYLEMYIREYLRFHAAIYKIPKTRVEEVILETGLSPEAHKKIGQLSKGYRQRVGLACALLHNPEVLILDEPSTGLDPNQIIEIRDLIKKSGKDKTVFLSTHIMQEVEAICDRVIIINQGKIVADHKLSELTQNQQQLIEVVFDSPVDKQLFNSIPKLSKLIQTTPTSFELIFDTPEDMRSEVFEFVTTHQLKMIHLNRKQKTLETIFRELTTT